MPAKKVINKEKILRFALEMVENEGEKALSARALAARMGCSTQPIYLSFSGMEELRNALGERARAIYGDYFLKEEEESLFMKSALSFLRFAYEKPRLFDFLYGDHPPESGNADAEFRREIISRMQAIGGYSEETAERFFLECRVYFHGLATLYAHGQLTLSWDGIRALALDEFAALKNYFGGSGHAKRD